MMGKTCLIDTHHNEGKPWKVIAERAGHSQSTVSKHNYSVDWKEKVVRKGAQAPLYK